MRISDWSSDVCSSDLLVVDHREGRHRPGAHAEVGHQAVGATEGEAAGAEALAQSLQIDRTVLQAGDQPHLALLVAQEEVLDVVAGRSEEHTSELKSLMRISYAVFCLKKQKKIHTT